MSRDNLHKISYNDNDPYANHPEEEAVMKRCVICRALNLDQAETCTRCGHELFANTLNAGMKVAWVGFTIAILGFITLWALSVTGNAGLYPFAWLALVLGMLSIFIGLFSFRTNV